MMFFCLSSLPAVCKMRYADQRIFFIKESNMNVEAQSRPLTLFRQLSIEPGSSLQKQHERAQVELFLWLQHDFDMSEELAQLISSRYASCYSYMLPKKVAELKAMQENAPESIWPMLFCLNETCMNAALPEFSVEKRGKIYQYILIKVPELSIVQREFFMNDAVSSVPTQKGLGDGISHLLSEIGRDSPKYSYW